MTAYYNEIDPYAAQWLRNLIAVGHIAPGEVDERSILDVSPDDLTGFVQCHFFAGIGVWSHALRLAGWSDDRPVWTGSCPCQPFSVAGLGAGFDDERHLWPFWFHLIEQCRPGVVFGEQVEAAVRHGWLDLVQSDLEGIRYAFAATGIPAAGVGAPHIRQRLFFVADSSSSQGLERSHQGAMGQQCTPSERSSGAGELADTDRITCSEGSENLRGRPAGSHAQPRTRPGGGGLSGRMGHPQGERLGEARQSGPRSPQRLAYAGPILGGVADANGERRTGDAGAVSLFSKRTHRPQSYRNSADDRPGPINGFWGAADWLLCRDGRWRPVEPGTFPLAHGAPARVGRLRAYGNAICAPVAAEFVSAFMECHP